MRVVLAPDGFAGTLTAAAAVGALAEGWRRVRPHDELLAVPMADGGEGTLAVVGAAVAGASTVAAEVADARGRATPAHWLRLPDGRALVEVAQACGLSQLPAGERDPLEATSYGAGQLVRAAIAAGAVEVVVGLGGTATIDGGVGMAIALGAKLLRADGNGVRVGGRWVATLDRVAAVPPLGAPLIAAIDVTAPLLGADGAARRFGAQKGASPEAMASLEAALAHLADVVEGDVAGGPWRDRPGAGAAGGMGFTLMALYGARPESGAAIVGELVGLPAALAGAEVVITGEGALDVQTSQGKVAAHVLAAGRAAGARVFAVAGRVDAQAAEVFDASRGLGPDGLDRAAELVADAAEDLARSV